jgi:hypothetical protein
VVIFLVDQDINSHHDFNASSAIGTALQMLFPIERSVVSLDPDLIPDVARLNFIWLRFSSNKQAKKPRSCIIQQ